jgi:pimeloyl-ACP methyl ester carboxylesterase
VTVVLVHGAPETSEIWNPLREKLGRETVALSLPGFGTARPVGFAGTKDAYAEWLASELTGLDGPIDLVGHDFGALFTLRLASAFAIPSLRSWVVDVANIFHPDYVWFERARRLQIQGVGEDMLKAEREAHPGNPASTAAHLTAGGVSRALAGIIAASHDETMSQSILDFYRSAIPNVAATWWKDVRGPTTSHGLVLLLPDPPEDEKLSLEVADRLGAKTARLNDLNHCWMAEAPELVAQVLERFWSQLG